MLTLIATPIGNLADITYRAITELNASAYILCEDTKRSGILMKHYDIKPPLRSYHKFSEARQEEEILKDLKSGLKIALISDAGTPGISDPGERLVAACYEHEIPVSACPGPCAMIQALTLSGYSTAHIQFIGFLPKKTQQRQQALVSALQFPGTTALYESPKRLIDTLNTLKELAPSRKLAIARELTKTFEEVPRGTAEELIAYFTSHTLKGEIVLIIEGTPQMNWEDTPPLEHVAQLELDYKLSKKEAIKLAAELRGVPKREIYQASIE